MALETKTALNQETIDRLQDLIQYNIDARDGFQEAAEQVDEMSVAEMFRQCAQERSANATELQQFVTRSGEEAEDSGSFSAAAHRAWLDLRATFTGGSAHAVLAEAERGEDHIKDAYEKFLKECPGSAVNDVVQQQYMGIKAAHDRVRQMRDAMAE